MVRAIVRAIVRAVVALAVGNERSQLPVQEKTSKYSMKDAEQLIRDFNENEELRKKFQEALNKLRSDENLNVMEAGIKVARDLGYEISDDEAKKFITRMQDRRNSVKTQLSDEELESAAGGSCDNNCYFNCFGCGSW